MQRQYSQRCASPVPTYRGGPTAGRMPPAAPVKPAPIGRSTASGFSAAPSEGMALVDVVFHALSSAGVSPDDMADVLMGCLALATLECIPEDVLARIEDAPVSPIKQPEELRVQRTIGVNALQSGPPPADLGSPLEALQEQRMEE